jgi:MoaA/NifB/PqqE/SkfB family radical SAM enzyme
MQIKKKLKKIMNYLTNSFHYLPVIFLWVNNVCNARCIMCDIWKSKENEQLDFLEIQQLVTFLSKFKLETVVLTGGEPLLHPDFSKICQWLYGQKLRISVCTNGLLIKKYVKEISKYIDSLVVSLDGGTEGLHDRIRGVTCFRNVLESIQRLKREKESITIVIRYVIQKLNYYNLDQAIDVAKKNGADYITFVPICSRPNTFGHKEEDQDVYKNIITLNREEIVKCKKEIEKLIKTYRQDFKSGFILTNCKKMKWLSQYLELLEGGTHSFYPFCTVIWTSLVFKYNGKITPCFLQDDFGNFREQPLDTILKSTARKKIYSNIRRHKSYICKNCPADFIYVFPKEKI